MSKIKEISDKFFQRESPDKNLKQFVQNLTADASQTVGVVSVFSPKDYTINGNDVYRFLSDRGAGRIYDGLKSLEFMARTIRGASLESASLFDGKIIVHTVNEMKAASVEQASIIVNANIGIQEVYLFAKQHGLEELVKYNVFILKIARLVKAGTFKTEDHIAEALVRVKALVRSALNVKVIR